MSPARADTSLTCEQERLSEEPKFDVEFDLNAARSSLGSLTQRVNRRISIHSPFVLLCRYLAIAAHIGHEAGQNRFHSFIPKCSH